MSGGGGERARVYLCGWRSVEMPGVGELLLCSGSAFVWESGCLGHGLVGAA